MSEFWQKYKHPNWQKRRLEIMALAEFQCSECGAKDDTLNVHHRIYRKGANPWDYADHELACLCEKCHEVNHNLKQRLNEALAKCNSYEVEFVLGYADAIHHWSFGPDPLSSIKVTSYEHACGIADAYGRINADDVVDLACKSTDNTVTIDQLWALHLKKKEGAKK